MRSIIYILLLVIILSALSFNHAFSFHLYTDDWYQILGALYYPERLSWWFAIHPGGVLEVKLFAPFFKFNFKSIALFSLRAILLLPLIPITTFIFHKYFGVTNNFSQYTKNLFLFNFSNLIQVLENVLFGWTLLPKEIVFWATGISLFIFPLLIILFLWKKSEVYKIISFLYIWIFLFYLPNFLTQYFARSGMAVESRYYAISAVGVVGLLAYGFSFIKSRYINWIVFFFLLFNLYVTNRVLLQYSTFL